MFRPAVHGDGKAVDGAWWPRSRDVVAQLPHLLAAAQSNHGLAVTRVAYHRDSWNDGVGRTRVIGGDVVRFGWFNTIDPSSVSLTGPNGQARLDLVVIPATSDPLLAERVFAWIQDGHRHDGASEILMAAGTSVDSPSPGPGTPG